MNNRRVDHKARKLALEAAFREALRHKDQVLAAVVAAQLRQYREARSHA